MECRLLFRRMPSLNAREVLMHRQTCAIDQVLACIRSHPGCTLDELTQYLQDLTWSEVFLEVDRLSRSGDVRLTQSGFDFIATIQAR
jgi:hypothetical protein